MNYMEQSIFMVREQLDFVSIQLDNYYVQVKLHHERKDYEKALEVFSIIGPLQKQAVQLQEKLRFYRMIEEMNRQGILAERVYRVDETSLLLDR